MKKGIVALIIFAAIPFFVHATTPLPGKPEGFVSDFAGILSNQRAELETTLSNFKKETGNEIAVVTINSLGDESVETYAVRLFEMWGIGEKDKDNGALLLIAMNEKKLRIEVGYGLEGDLTDAQASWIIRNILTPAFKDGRYGEGVKATVAKMIEALHGVPNAIPAEDESGINFGNWAFLLLFIPIWLGSILARSKSWWMGGVLGAVAGVIIGFLTSFVFTGIIAIVFLAFIGLVFDFIVSTAYHGSAGRGTRPPWWIGGGGLGGGHGSGGGFGGFGGGSSGGGGASGGW